MVVRTPQRYQSLPGLAPDPSTQINTDILEGTYQKGSRSALMQGGEIGCGWGNISTMLGKRRYCPDYHPGLRLLLSQNGGGAELKLETAANTDNKLLTVAGQTDRRG